MATLFIRRRISIRRLAALPRLALSLAEFWRLARQRRDLASLDARALQDIGLSRADVEGELAKPFWRR